ncbi:gustatory receptor for bitter taste 66a-like [Ochlerotatus camptorhynchus]|uniref:gustatory receptor for bitter taste 66a-like n=1 Tax=Ochlerotatus camptorhynchus TaxID=644619 RepID=UPI0031DE7F41
MIKLSKSNSFKELCRDADANTWGNAYRVAMAKIIGPTMPVEMCPNKLKVIVEGQHDPTTWPPIPYGEKDEDNVEQVSNEELIAAAKGNVNHRVVHAVGLLSDFDKNVTYWDRHKAKKSQVCRNVTQEVNQLCYLHRLTSKTLEQITEIFQLPMLLKMLFDFLIVIIVIFYTFTSFVLDLRNGHDFNYSANIGSVIFVSSITYRFYYTASFCEQLNRRAERTGVLLNEFLESEVDEEVDLSIELFSLELLHHHFKIEIFGFFTIDMSLIYNAVATMAGYLIILVQVELTE